MSALLSNHPDPLLLARMNGFRHNLGVNKSTHEPSPAQTVEPSGNPLAEQEPWPYRLQLLLRPEHISVVLTLFWTTTLLLIVYLAVFAWSRGGRLADVDRIEPRSSQYLIDINSAPAAELANLPGIGNVLAAEIVAFRKTHGPFTSLGQLQLIDGIGPRKLAAVTPFLLPYSAPSDLPIRQQSNQEIAGD